MLSTLLNRTVTISRRSPSADDDDTDDYGNQNAATPTNTETVGELQQRRRDEPVDQGELSDTRWLLVLPPGTAIDTSDIVTVDGDEFEVIGDPWHARNPRTGAESHVEVTLRRTSGPGS